MSKAFFIGLAVFILPIVVLAGDATSLDNPLSGISNLLQGSGYIGGVINRVLAIVGSLALLMLVYGGLSIILAAGNETKISQGKNIVTYTAIGLVVIFISYSAITFFLKTLGGTIRDEYSDFPVSPVSIDGGLETGELPAGSCPDGCLINISCSDPSQPPECISTPNCCLVEGQ